ncbi:MAG TPA: hypothetical protein PLK14_16520, partial [Sediminibacterium sp.]|nr:hypothetical protein [Sediminibacterium sp.]
RIWLLKRYTKWYQAPTVLLCNIFYFSLILGYFAARLRPKKLKASIRAIRDGVTLSIKYD